MIFDIILTYVCNFLKKKRCWPCIMFKKKLKSQHSGCSNSMSGIMRKPVFRVSNQVRHKPGCTATEDGLRHEIFGFRKKRDCTICVVKTNALISCACVTAQLICVFLFAYARKKRFSHDAAIIYFLCQCSLSNNFKNLDEGTNFDSARSSNKFLAF